MKKYLIGLITLGFIVFAGGYASADWVDSSESSARGVEFLRDIIEDMHRETTEAIEDNLTTVESELELGALDNPLNDDADADEGDADEGDADEGDIDDIDLAGLGGGDDDDDEEPEPDGDDGLGGDELDAVGGGLIVDSEQEEVPEGIKRIME